MRKYFSLILLLIFCASCDRQQQTTAQKEEAHEEQSQTAVSISPEQAKAISLEMKPIEKKDITSTIVSNGVLTVPSQHKAHITSLYGGIVRSILVQPGTAVRKGQPIATIVSAEAIQLQQEYLAANSQLTLAETELVRQKELLSGNATAAKRLQQAESETRALAAKKEGLSRNLEAIGISANSVREGAVSSILTITSPIEGTVSSITVQIGSNISTGMSIAEIVNNSELHLDLFVFEKDLPKIKSDQKVHFTLTNNPGRGYDATIFSIGTAFSSETKTIPIHANVQGNKTGLIEGMNVSAVVSISDAEMLAVPSTAIVTSQGKDYIFIQTKELNTANSEASKKDQKEKSEGSKDELHFAKVPIQRGTSNIGYTQITPISELPPDSQVVSSGAFFLLAKLTGVEEE